MPQNKTYIGITIGPIFDTMNLSSSPCALWASSYIFSFISKTVCDELVNKYKIDSKSIISPFFDKYDNDSKDIFDRNDGTGLFHDRIIFEKPEDFDVNVIKDIKSDVIDTVSNIFSINNTDYLNQYIMIAAAEYEAENPILGSGKILDSLELSKAFVPEETKNPIISVFSNNSNEENKNKAIKAIVEKLGIKDWQLQGEDGNIKDLGSISRHDKRDKKYNNYFAVVRADGDNMSKIIGSLGSTEEFNEFSKTCLGYCAAVADKVKEYGGVTIYAGGDDLLALVPAMGNNGTVFDFVKAVNAVFSESFKSYIDKINDENKEKEEKDKTPVPSLSAGVFICYKKFPLYEALNKSAELLFAKAKSVKKCAVVSLQKHSGQSVELMVSNDHIDNVINLQGEILKESDETLLSSLQKIEIFRTLFNSANENTIVNVFKNTFDAVFHNDNNFVHETLPGAFKNLLLSGKPVKLTDSENTDSAATFAGLLRIMKFYVEGGND